MISDDKLIVKARQADKSAFDELLRRHYAMVRRIAQSFASIDEDVNDLVQETFITAYDRLHQLDSPDRFTGWLAAIARNECRMWLRRRISQPTMLTLDEQNETNNSYTSATARQAREAMRRGAIREAIFDALAALNDQQQRVIRMHYLEGYDYRETADLLSVPISVVRGRLDRARHTLRKELKDMMPTNNSWELNKKDMDTMRLASSFARCDPEGPLNAIYFTGEGSFVCTDGCRLLHYGSSSLTSTPKVLVHADLARTLRDKYAGVHRGSLTFTDSKAVLLLPGGDVIEAPIIDSDYVEWRLVMPKEWRLNIRAKSGHWLQALELLKKQRENGLIETDPAWPSRLLMVLCPEDRRIVLRQGQDPISTQSLAREISVWFPADYSAGGPDTIIAFNADYLQEAITVLGLDTEQIVEMSVNPPDPTPGPIWTKPLDAQDVWVVTMPMAGVTHRCPVPEENAVR